MPETSITYGLAALARVAADNFDFTQQKPSSFFVPFQKGQNPYVTVVLCSDSRCQLEAFASQPFNNVFNVANAGNRFVAEAGSVSYGVKHLNTPLLLIVGHTDCGAIKAAMGDYSSEGENITALLDGLQPSLVKKHTDPSCAHAVTANVISNVNHQVAAAVAAYAERVEDESLLIVGAIFDMHNQFEKGYGQLHLFNLNGVTDFKTVSHDAVFASLEYGAQVLDISRFDG